MAEGELWPGSLGIRSGRGVTRAGVEILLIRRCTASSRRGILRSTRSLRRGAFSAHCDAVHDDPLQQVILGVCKLREGAPEIYAESGAQFVTMHMLVRHASRDHEGADAR